MSPLRPPTRAASSAQLCLCFSGRTYLQTPLSLQLSSKAQGMKAKLGSV